MKDPVRANRYHYLFASLGSERARALLDTLQVLALTRPEIVRELEAFIDRGLAAEQAQETALPPVDTATSDRLTQPAAPE